MATIVRPQGTGQKGFALDQPRPLAADRSFFGFGDAFSTWHRFGPNKLRVLEQFGNLELFARATRLASLADRPAGELLPALELARAACPDDFPPDDGPIASYRVCFAGGNAREHAAAYALQVERNRQGRLVPEKAEQDAIWLLRRALDTVAAALDADFTERCAMGVVKVIGLPVPFPLPPAEPEVTFPSAWFRARGFGLTRDMTEAQGLERRFVDIRFEARGSQVAPAAEAGNDARLSNARTEDAGEAADDRSLRDRVELLYREHLEQLGADRAQTHGDQRVLAGEIALLAGGERDTVARYLREIRKEDRRRAKIEADNRAD